MNIIYREKDIPNIHQLDVYVQHGGYAALQKALTMPRADVINEVKASNLRGRGGAGFPAGVKWSFIPQDNPINYVTVNADESETGTFKDRQIMENNPHQLIEGALICAYAVKAAAVYIYIRGEYWDVAAGLEKAIADAEAAGYFGPKNTTKVPLDVKGNAVKYIGVNSDIVESETFACRVFVHLGAGAYICGEESALLESLEGKMGQPRVRPPFPAQKGGGLYGEPTVVNNVETLANVPYIIANGAAAYKQMGTEQSTGTKIFCLSGHVEKPGNYELEFGKYTLRDLIYTFGGGIKGGRQIKGILPSGGSGPVIRVNGDTDAILDTPLTYEDLQKTGSILGSASVIIMDETVDMTWVASKVTKFFHHESCGKCTPCREGTYWLDKVIDRIMAGEARPNDIDLIHNVANNMKGVTLCALGEFAANPILHTIKHFPEDFRAHTSGAAKPARTAAAAGGGD
ncbi:MAG: NADH-ubiquinone oxidoreductase-F iron-sulfur binding region domain-containing protein [bacterium]|nr:NADH-ubiquinone oxidoreductase-F iron-sulfur binding region domain-containing protein [bacterium]